MFVSLRRGLVPSDLGSRLNSKGINTRYKIIGAFDSTYHDETITTYRDGIEFLKGIGQVLDDFHDIFLVLKEKKPRAILGLYCYDPRELAEMKEILDHLEAHPRCYVAGHSCSASELIAVSDLVLCFPFTSTGMEAMASWVMALYYDATAKFKETDYARISGLVAHGYQSLKHRVDEILYRMDAEDRKKFIEESVRGDFETFLDGMAISRFRKLLV